MDKELTGWREYIHNIIFKTDTFKGKLFDAIIFCSIIISVITVILESVYSINTQYGHILRMIEWFFTILFTVEYILRLVSVKKPRVYVKSFYGVIDLISILPTYLSLFYLSLQSLLVFRIFRLLKLFRRLKIVRHFSGENTLINALRASKSRIILFLTTVVSVVIITGAIMYIIEGPVYGFTNMFVSMYWAVVTMTTVGYGDVVPRTVLGKVFASILMILGYAIIAVPTGIISAELAKANTKDINKKTCNTCSTNSNDSDATYCKTCGNKL